MSEFGWVLFIIVALWAIPATTALICRQLTPESDPEDSEFPELISVIIPARNEEAQIEKALQSVLASRNVRLEFIVVNDRSTDATGEIIDRAAAGDDRVSAIHISELPSGWLGKNHAMHIAAEQAGGSLLLFTDGDVIYEPLAILTAARHLRKHQLQHLCLLPRMLPGSLLENATVAWFGLAFAIGTQLQLINTRWPRSYAGVGAFNMTDAQFYRTCGGHQQIAMDVLDDVKLGKLIKNNGGHQDFQSAPALLSIRWQSSLWGVVTGLEKNGFAALNYSLFQLLLMSAAFLGTMILPCVAAVVLPLPEAAGFIATAVTWHICYGAASALAGGGWKLTPLYAAATSIMAFAFWRSAWITLRQGGVRWRDSFYPLSQLRPGVYK